MIGSEEEWEEDLLDLIYGAPATRVAPANKQWQSLSRMYLGKILYPGFFAATQYPQPQQKGLNFN